jgi:membrane fusion protein, multidrug efflux system
MESGEPMLERFKKNLLRNKGLVALILLAVSIVLGGVLVAGRSKAPAQTAPPPLSVEVVQVEQHDVPIYSEWIGTTQGLVNAEIKAQVTGYLLRQDYKEGSVVKKGELLFEIDPRPFQATLDQANAQVAQRQGELEQANSQVLQADAQVAQANSRLAEAEAQLASAEANLVKTQLDVDKYRPLVQEQAVTQQEYDNAVQSNVVSRAQVDAAKAGVKSAQAQVAQSKAQIATAKAGITTAQGQLENARAAVRTASLNLGFTRIISPIDGVAGIAQAQVGNLVSSTGPPLTAISTLDPIKVYFTISEQEYLAFNHPAFSNAVEKDSMAQLQFELTLSDGSTFPQGGTFHLADRQVDPTTGAIRLEGIFLNPGNILRPGQYAKVRAVTSKKLGGLLVPQRAVSELQGLYQVAVVGPDKKISIRTVKLGERSGSMWVVEDGLKVGEVVVAEGTQKVRPGMIVEPKPFAGTAVVAQQ